MSCAAVFQDVEEVIDAIDDVINKDEGEEAAGDEEGKDQEESEEKKEEGGDGEKTEEGAEDKKEGGKRLHQAHSLRLLDVIWLYIFQTVWILF